MKKRYKFLIVLLLLLVGVYFLYRNRVAIVSSFAVPHLEHDTIHVQIMDDTTYMHTEFYATNKSFLPLTIDNISYKIVLNGHVYLQEEKWLGIDLEAYSNDEFPFSLKIPTAAILKDLKETRKDTVNANYSIFATVQYSTFFGPIIIPISKAGAFKPPTPPELKVMSVKYTKLKFDNMPIVVTVRLINHGNLSTTLKELTYHLEVPNHGSVDGVYPGPIEILPKSEMFVDLRAEVQWKNLGGILIDVIRDEDHYAYVLDCTGEIVGEDTLQKPILIELNKTGTMELKK